MKATIAVVGLLALASAGLAHVDTLDVNRWRFPLNSYGPFGQGAAWRMPAHEYLFGCGLWFGAVAGGDTLTSIAYNPNSGASEFSAGDSLGDSLALVYITPHRWPPPAERFPRAPQATRADQDAWTLYHDFDPAGHIAPGRPLGLQVFVNGYAFDSEAGQDLTFLRFEFENQSDAALEQCYVGAVFDPDIGDYADDMYGAFYQRWLRLGGDSLWVDHVAYAWDNNGSEPGWDSVGAVAAFFITTPGAQGPSAMKRFTVELDPVTDPAQYLTLAGYDYRTGEYAPFDTTDGQPADKRFLLATGPFDLAPGACESLVVAIIGHLPWPDSFGLARAVARADSLYRFGAAAVAEERPVATARLAARPQPFAASVRIDAGPALAGVLYCELRDVAGRRVRTLERTPGGAWNWDGRDAAGRAVPAGVYYAVAGGVRLKLVRR
ncbi:MAG: hypothetical protein R6X12_02620 [bacterium]